MNSSPSLLSVLVSQCCVIVEMDAVCHHAFYIATV